MASFPRKIFDSLPGMNQASQLLLLANNMQGIGDDLRSKIIGLSLLGDDRVVAAMNAFLLDRNTENLVKSWQAIAHVAPPSPVKRLNLPQAVTQPVQGQGSPRAQAKRRRTTVRSARPMTRKTTTVRSDQSPLLSPRGTTMLAGGEGAPVLSDKDLVKVRDKLGLGLIEPRTVVSRIKAMLASKESISKPEFTEMLLSLQKSNEGFHKMKQQQAAELLFDFIDTNKNGQLDRGEILNSLVALIGGSPDDKIEAAFMIYDTDGNGLISYDEMLAHQRAVFNMIFTMKPELQESCRETAESLALITTEKLFQDLDINGDRVLTLAEFKAWYHRDTADTTELQAEKQARIEAAKASTLSIQEGAVQAKKEMSSVERLQAIQAAKEVTGLDTVHVMDALSLFKEQNTCGFFSRQQFYDILYRIITELAGLAVDPNCFNQVAADIFLRFDRDGNGVVDLGELFSGMSLLCAGNAGDKLKAACYVFDDSGDGRMQFEELKRYFHATFQLVMSNMSVKVSTDKLAEATAKNLFEDKGISVEEGSLAYEDIKDWVDKTLSKFL